MVEYDDAWKRVDEMVLSEKDKHDDPRMLANAMINMRYVIGELQGEVRMLTERVDRLERQQGLG